MQEPLWLTNGKEKGVKDFFPAKKELKFTLEIDCMLRIFYISQFFV